MEEHDQASLEALVEGLKVFDEAAINFLIHFVQIFEVYPYEVWATVAKTKGGAKRILILATWHSDAYIRQCVAWNSHTPKCVLEVLAEDGDGQGGIQEGVACNSNTPAGILKILAEKEDSWIRWGVAHNLSSPPDILERLARDESEWVRECVAGNPSTPTNALKELAKDKIRKVRDAALLKLKLRGVSKLES